MKAVTVVQHDGITVVTVDYPPVNALSVAVRTGLAAAIDDANADPAVRGIVIRATGSTFIAGADVKELAQGLHLQSPTLKELQQRLEKGKPSVAAIHGTALGGGLELALTCTYRVALANAKVGLPEVKLGLVPGAGGTQRLTRLCGPEVALELCLSGRQADADEALSLGIIDGVVEDLDDAPLRFLVTATPRPPIIARDDKVSGVDPGLFTNTRLVWERKARGRDAPGAVIDCVEAACRLPADEGLVFERATFDRLRDGEQHPALVHAFMAERQAAKLPFDPAPEPERVARAGVIGGGLMGAGIALVLARAGIAVTIVEVGEAARIRCDNRVDALLAAALKRGVMTEEASATTRAAIRCVTDFGALADADLTIEAAPEIIEIKQDIFRKLDAILPGHSVIATNTSSLDIDAMAAATARPGQVIGLHFFSPANVMKLVEVIRGTHSSQRALMTGMALVRRLAKVGVLVGNCDGFLANRTLQFYTGQAEFLMEQGVRPQQIDGVAEAFGMPMGPVAMRDMAGLDIAALVRQVRAKTLPPGERLSPLIERMVEAGRFGQKSGAGFYRYESGKRTPDPEAEAIIDAAASQLGVERRRFNDEEIRDRLFLPIVNEGARTLEEGIAQRASDVDVAWINGYGFPAHRGGPMYWGLRQGLDRVVALAEEIGAEHGPRWQPAPLIRRLATSGESWRDSGF